MHIYIYTYKTASQKFFPACSANTATVWLIDRAVTSLLGECTYIVLSFLYLLQS